MQKAPGLKAGSRAAFPTTLDVQGGETDRTAFFSTELIFFSSQLFRSAQQTLGLDPELSGIFCTRSRAAQPSDGSQS